MTKIRKHGEIDGASKLLADWRSMMIVHAVYEHGPLRYRDLDAMLELSPTILSGKLTQLAQLGVITRIQADGAKGVQYETTPLSNEIVKAYHLLESVNEVLQRDRKVLC